MLADSVFQGTVLGPPLWNLFFADAKFALDKDGFLTTVFADDLNTWKSYKLDHDSEDLYHEALSDLRGAQTELHSWGRANQVRFDPSKESFHVLHRTHGHGEDFNILGCVYDSKLLMHTGARRVATEAG